MKRACDNCGVEYERPPSHIGRFCSHRCSKVNALLDRTGVRYGALVALALVSNGDKGPVWSFRCDCGTMVERVASNVVGAAKAAKAPNCGCLLRGRASTLSRDLTGRTFGRLTALRCLPAAPHRNGVHWVCRCACGNEKTLRSGLLTTGQTISCGCAVRENTGRRMVDGSGAVTLAGRLASAVAVGDTFGRLTVTGEANRRRGRRFMSCTCACGAAVDVQASQLVAGQTKSCGCLRGTAHMRRGRAIKTAADSYEGAKLTILQRLELERASA